MKTKLNWINKGFIDKELYAPFVVKDDLTYIKDLRKKYRLLYEKAKGAGADEKSLHIILKYTGSICRALNAYYKGEITKSHTIIKRLVKNCIDNPIAVNSIENSVAFLGTRGSEIQFFRARSSEGVKKFSSKEMLHLPITMRGKTGNYRFSIPGVPSFYLGNSSYVCWLEMGMPSDYKFNVSPVLLDNKQKIFNLAVMTRMQMYLNELEEENVHCWIKLLIIMIATSYVVEEENRIFKSEYIISQSVMLACKELGLDGVAYFSKRVSDELFASVAINLALFAPYKYGKEYSEICEHIKIDESYNYAMFKQLGEINKNKTYELRSVRTGWTAVMGDYKKYYEYTDTEFYKFDKFLFSSWKEKDNIDWGNALV